MTARTTQRSRRSRLNMRIPGDLLMWAKDYALSKNTNLTQLFIDHLTKLKEKTNGVNSKAS